MYMTIRRLLFALSKYDTIAPSLMDKLRTEQCHVSGYYVLSMSSNCKVLVLVICPWNGINNHVAGLTVVLSSYLVLQQTCSPTTTTGKMSNSINVMHAFTSTVIAYSNTIVFHSPGEHRMTL